MVHAGVHRDWDPLQTVKLAREVERTLQGNDHTGFLAQMYGNEPNAWSPDLTGIDRLRLITNWQRRPADACEIRLQSLRRQPHL